MTEHADDSDVLPAESAGAAPLGQGDDAGLSLDELGAAFAQMLDAGHDPYAATAEPDAHSDSGGTGLLDPPGDDEPSPADAADDGCELSPRTILEAMLFVGHPANEPLSAAQVAGMMRGVRPAEIDEAVSELNEQYARNDCPYAIVSQGAGYVLALRDEFAALRDKFHGRLRQARLSPAALEVLALVAYNQPLTSEDVARLRGRTSGPILAQLVRRQLLRLERPPATPRRARYFTTARFLKLFGLESLDDLPRGQEIEPR